MKQKNFDYVPSAAGEFESFSKDKHNLSNYEYDLFKEEDDIVTSVIRVKRVKLPNNGENWKLIKDNKIVELIEGIKLSSKEKNYLRSVEGIQFLIQYYKNGWKSLNNLRLEMKSRLLR